MYLPIHTQQADKLEWAVALLKLRKGTKGLAGNSNSGGSGSNDDGSTNSSGGTTNNSWFTSRMPTFGERAALTQAVQELAHQNALDEVRLTSGNLSQFFSGQILHPAQTMGHVLVLALLPLNHVLLLNRVTLWLCRVFDHAPPSLCRRRSLPCTLS